MLQVKWLVLPKQIALFQSDFDLKFVYGTDSRNNLM